MTDATTLFWLSAASCVVAPVIVCRAIPKDLGADRALALRVEPQEGLAASRFDHGEKRPDQLTNPNSINSRERN